MGRSFFTYAGPQPDIARNYDAWYRWYCTGRNAWLRACPRSRATTLYTSWSDGNDGGDGSIIHPFKTISFANSVIAGSNGNLAMLLKCGDIWDATAGLLTTKDNVTLGSYNKTAGAGYREPLINRYTIKYNSTGWSHDSGNLYHRTEANIIDNVREQNDREIFYMRCASSAECGALPYSYYWASSVLYINPGPNLDPNAINYEALIRNSTTGVEVRGDGCRVFGLRADGWGVNWDITANQNYCFRHTSFADNQLAVFENVVGFGSSSHVMGTNNDGTNDRAAPKTLWLGAIAGGAVMNGDPGETIFNSYNGTGGQEEIWERCVPKYGTLPTTSKVGTSAPYNVFSATAFYGHTGGGLNAYSGLQLTVDCFLPRNHIRSVSAAYPYTCPRVLGGAGFAHINPAATTDNFGSYGAVIVRERSERLLLEQDINVPSSFTPASLAANLCYGCYWDITSRTGLAALFGGAPDATWINCLTKLRMLGSTSNLAFTGLSGATMLQLHCAMLITSEGGTVTWPGFYFSLNGDNDGFTAINSIYQFETPSYDGGGIGGLPSVMNHNALFNSITPSRDANAIILDAPLTNLEPLPDGQLYGAGGGSIIVSHDMNGRRRKVGRQDIGPIAAISRDFPLLLIGVAA